MEAKAIARHIRIAPRKIRIVADLVRGKNIGEAFAILKFTPKVGADVVEKVMRSAIANAEHNFDMNVDNLYVSEIFVDQGPTLKRIHPRSRGQAFKILKRTSHVTVKDFAANLHEDVKIRNFLKETLFIAGISRIEIERTNKRIKLTIHTAKPGMVIGRGGAGIEDIKKAMTRFTDKQVDVNIAEIKQADMDAVLVAENIAGQLERRIGFRRAMKQAVGRTMRLGAKGIKIMVSGRLGGAEIARSESYREGSIPLHTLRANIDYGTAEAHTTYGCIGIKVWIYKGEVLPEAKQPAKKEEGGK